MKIKKLIEKLNVYQDYLTRLTGKGYQSRSLVIKTHARLMSSFFVLALVASALALQSFSSMSVSGATGDILAVRISDSSIHKGWVAEVDIEDKSSGGEYDFGFTTSTPANLIDASAKLKLTVTSPGYDSDGNATTMTRTVYGTTSLRQPYPNQALADETVASGVLTVRVVLSEFIYEGETVTADIGAGLYAADGTANVASAGQVVTNNSTNTYPKPVGRWSWPPYERVNGDFLLETTAFHRFGQDAKPLAAVKYTCQDESGNSDVVIVSEMTKSTRQDAANTGSEVLVYAATMPIENFAQGDVITCNFLAYPWVGDSSSVLSSELISNGGDGYAQPDERLGPLELLNDKDGTYGEPCAIVSSTGQASLANTWVYASCAAAEAAYASDSTNAYADIGRAAQAIRSYNNANHGHNDPGGGTIALLEQNYTTPGTGPAATLGTQKTWLTIKPAPSVPCQAPVINANGNDDLKAQKLKYECISTLTNAGNTFRGDSSLTDILWLDKMKLNSTEPAPIRHWDTMYVTGNTVDALKNGFTGWYGATVWPSALVRGNNYTALDEASGVPLMGLLNNVIGNKNITPHTNYNDGTRNLSDNSIYAFNTVINSDNSRPEIQISSNYNSNFTHGIAIVQNVVEATLSGQPVVAIQNMGGTDSINNLIFWHNTTRGQRSNVAYASDSSRCSEPLPYFNNWSWKYNIESNHNHIDEVRNDHGCPADGGRIGNWSMNFSVGGAGNARAVGAGPSWSPQDYLGMYSVGVLAEAGFVNDRSSTEYGGAGGGNGDYRLTEASTLRNVIPQGQAVLPYDLDGNARYNSGQGTIGSYELLTSADTTAPTISSFSIPATGSSLTITGITFTASDNVAVTGYMLTESATAPGASDAGWSESAPSEYTFATYGSKTLYAWAKDAAGNVSTSMSDTVTLTEPTYTIGGTTSGLVGSVVLQNNGVDNLTVTGNDFTFDGQLRQGEAYDVTVLTQPARQNCVVFNGTGVTGMSDISSVVVTCVNVPVDCSSEPVSTTGRATQTISVPETGNYSLWSRMKAPSGSPVEYMVFIDNQCFVIGQTALPENVLTWIDYQNGDTSDKAVVNLTAGTHTLVMTAGSENLELDRIMLLSDSCSPVGTGDNCLNDTVDPTVSLTSPGSAATVSGVVTLTANASDNDAVDYVEFYHGGTTLIGSDETAPYSAAWNTATIANGSYQLTARAYDMSGNVSTSGAVNVTVNNVQPVDAEIDSFTATPTAITAGESSTLQWVVSSGGDCTINQGVGAVGSSGTRAVTPTSTTSYQLSCQGENGGANDTASVTVTVSPLVPVDAVIQSFGATPSSITSGDEATLAWSVSAGQDCSINHGIGDVALTGSRPVSPTSTLTYTLTCDGQHGGSTDSASATLTVTAPLDDDGDGAPNAVEENGPNNGDANHDGTPDAQQPNVVSLLNAKTGDYNMLVADGDCSAYRDARSITGEGVDIVLGVWSFSLECVSLGGSASVTIYLDDEYDTSRWRALKLSADLQSHDDVSSLVDFESRTLGPRTVTALTYSLTDGGLYDQDGVANGVIIDPFAIQLIQAAGVDNPGQVVGDGEDDGESLADTGANVWVYVLLSLSMMGVGIASVVALVGKSSIRKRGY